MAWRTAEPLRCTGHAPGSVNPVAGKRIPGLGTPGVRGGPHSGGSGRAEEVTVGSDGFAGGVGVGGRAEEYDLAAMWGAPLGKPPSTRPVETLTMRPQWCSRMSATTARASR